MIIAEHTILLSEHLNTSSPRYDEYADVPLPFLF